MLTEPALSSTSVTPRRDGTVVLVVPCYNEAHRLDVAAFTRALEDWSVLRLVFVDDGSVDGTLARLHELAMRIPSRVSVLALPENVGKAEAVRRGLLYALDGGVGLVGYWDADLATPLSAARDFSDVLASAPACAVVLGARVRLLGRRIDRRPLRHYLGRLFATGASVALGLAVYDTQCGAKLFRATDGLRAALDRPFLSRWVFDVELLARLRSGDGDETFYEYPLLQWRDVAGSKLSAWSAARAGVDLVRIWAKYREGETLVKRPSRRGAQPTRVSLSDAPLPAPTDPR
jgi:glycosyltransferase involved in cell wall biosynthesis